MGSSLTREREPPRRSAAGAADGATRSPGQPGPRWRHARLALLILATAILLVGAAAAGLSCYLTFGNG